MDKDIKYPNIEEITIMPHLLNANFQTVHIDAPHPIFRPFDLSTLTIVSFQNTIPQPKAIPLKNNQPEKIPPPYNTEEEEFEVERIIGKKRRIGPDGQLTNAVDYLVQWKGYPGEDSWEPEENLYCKELVRKFENESRNKRGRTNRARSALSRKIERLYKEQRKQQLRIAKIEQEKKLGVRDENGKRIPGMAGWAYVTVASGELDDKLVANGDLFGSEASQLEKDLFDQIITDTSTIEETTTILETKDCGFCD